MTEVKIPSEIVDADIENIISEYGKVRNDFWQAYKANKKQIKNASEAQELKDDITRMSKDLSNLTLRLEKQKEKVNSVPNKIPYMERSKAFRAEMNHQKKLTNQVYFSFSNKCNITLNLFQYKNTKELIRNLDDLKNNLKSTLEIKKHSRKGNVDLLQQIKEEIKVNKILYSSEVPLNLKSTSKELMLTESIFTEYVPSDEEINKLKNQVNFRN